METNEKRIRRLQDKALTLPLLPGVYFMKNAAGTVIYVGKARALKNRVSQYFTALHRHTPKVYQMVMHVQDFEYVVCDSEFEALMLECSMIKQYSPKYNILLKDDKGYHYIKITRGQWPVMKAVKQKDDPKAEYIGPYNSFFVVRQTVDEVCKIFKLQQCNKQFPRDIGKERPCLNHYIDACCAPCSGRVKPAEYQEAFRQAVQFIKGGAGASVRELKAEMNAAAENLEFERAARLRDRIAAIEKIKQRQKVVTSTYARQDVIAMAAGEKSACFQVFSFVQGRLQDRRQYVVDISEAPAEARAAFIKQFYDAGRDIPPRIAVDAPVQDASLLEQWLGERLGKKVTIAVPQKGEQKQLIEMCAKNAAEYLAQSMGRTDSATAALDELAQLLGLPKAPEYIESYDISNTAGDENVGGMVVFKNGEPHKSSYRKFKIQGFTGQDDFGSLREVLRRRFNEYLLHKGEPEGFGRLPDLILLDGGKPQLAAVQPILQEFGLQIPLFGMVKDGKHKTDAITGDGGNIAIKSNRRAYTLVSKIQEEVHRYAITYHRQRRKNSGIRLTLTEIPGIGPQKAKNLLQRFKTVAAIKEATPAELAGVDKVTTADAQRIYEFFRR